MMNVSLGIQVLYGTESNAPIAYHRMSDHVDAVSQARIFPSYLRWILRQAPQRNLHYGQIQRRFVLVKNQSFETLRAAADLELDRLDADAILDHSMTSCNKVRVLAVFPHIKPCCSLLRGLQSAMDAQLHYRIHLRVNAVALS